MVLQVFPPDAEPERTKVGIDFSQTRPLTSKGLYTEPSNNANSFHPFTSLLSSAKSWETPDLNRGSIDNGDLKEGCRRNAEFWVLSQLLQYPETQFEQTIIFIFATICL